MPLHPSLPSNELSDYPLVGPSIPGIIRGLDAGWPRQPENTQPQIHANIAKYNHASDRLSQLGNAGASSSDHDHERGVLVELSKAIIDQLLDWENDPLISKHPRPTYNSNDDMVTFHKNGDLKSFQQIHTIDAERDINHGMGVEFNTAGEPTKVSMYHNDVHNFDFDPVTREITNINPETSRTSSINDQSSPGFVEKALKSIGINRDSSIDSIVTKAPLEIDNNLVVTMNAQLNQKHHNLKLDIEKLSTDEVRTIPTF